MGTIQERSRGVKALSLDGCALAEEESVEVRVGNEWLQGRVVRRYGKWKIALGTGRSITGVGAEARRVKEVRFSRVPNIS